MFWGRQGWGVELSLENLSLSEDQIGYADKKTILI